MEISLLGVVTWNIWNYLGWGGPPGGMGLTFGGPGGIGVTFGGQAEGGPTTTTIKKIKEFQ